MKNCLVLGSGRSGTSMMAMLLANAGYHVGDYIYPPDEGNPLGYYEDAKVNEWNDAILAPTYATPLSRVRRFMSGKPQLAPLQGWLLDLSPAEAGRLQLAGQPRTEFAHLLSRQPFAYKDPRFSFTLRTIAPLLPADVGFVCIYRNPAEVASSTMREGARDAASRGWTVKLDREYCLSSWVAHYTCILDACAHLNRLPLVISYNELVSGGGDALAKLSDFLGIRIDGGPIRPELNRQGGKLTGDLPVGVRDLYDQLQELGCAT